MAEELAQLRAEEDKADEIAARMIAIRRRVTVRPVAASARLTSVRVLGLRGLRGVRCQR